MLFISYATPSYYVAQKELSKEAYQCGFEEVKEYNYIDIDKEFFEQNKQILSHSRGAGSALWKPYFILKNLECQDTFYMDCGDRIKNFSFKNYVERKLKENGYFLVQGTHPHSINTRRDCFTLMGCNEEKFWNVNQLEAGICGFTREYYWFVQNWLDWCRVTEVVMDTPNKDLFDRKNFDGFIKHRYDQSILTNLAIKYNLITIPIQEVMKYVDYNARG